MTLKKENELERARYNILDIDNKNVLRSKDFYIPILTDAILMTKMEEYEIYQYIHGNVWVNFMDFKNQSL